MKKIIAIILVLVILSALVLPVFAEETDPRTVLRNAEADKVVDLIKSDGSFDDIPETMSELPEEIKLIWEERIKDWAECFASVFTNQNGAKINICQKTYDDALNCAYRYLTDNFAAVACRISEATTFNAVNRVFRDTAYSIAFRLYGETPELVYFSRARYIPAVTLSMASAFHIENQEAYGIKAAVLGYLHSADPETGLTNGKVILDLIADNLNIRVLAETLEINLCGYIDDSRMLTEGAVYSLANSSVFMTADEKTAQITEYLVAALEGIITYMDCDDCIPLVEDKITDFAADYAKVLCDEYRLDLASTISSGDITFILVAAVETVIIVVISVAYSKKNKELGEIKNDH